MNRVNLFEELWTVSVMYNACKNTSGNYSYPVPHCLIQSYTLCSFPRLA